MQSFDFYQPKTLRELTCLLAESGGRMLAGGTDLVPRMRREMFSATALVDASLLKELCFIREDNARMVIGALTTHQMMADSALIRTVAPALADAAQSVGCQQTRYRGTLGGNIANASPAADTVPPLMVLDALLHLLSQGGERSLPLDAFLLGPGKTALKAGEIIHSVSFPLCMGLGASQPGWGCAFQKMGKRNGMAISVVNAAAMVQIAPSGVVETVRLALGCVAPTVVRCPKAEGLLMGQLPSPELLKIVAEAAAGSVSPISDVRSTAEYRRHAVEILAQRVLNAAIFGDAPPRIDGGMVH